MKCLEKIESWFEEVGEKCFLNLINKVIQTISIDIQQPSFAPNYDDIQL